MSHKTCTECGTADTPLWRKGPDGIKDYCNACGIRWKRNQTGPKKVSRKKSKPIIVKFPRRYGESYQMQDVVMEDMEASSPTENNIVQILVLLNSAKL
jgi:uncharacterized Zn finger protein (UPF0148 family)